MASKAEQKKRYRELVTGISKIISGSVIPKNDVFVECGVKQGTSSAIIATQLGISGYLFDTWYGFPNFSDVDVHSENAKKKMRKRMRTASDTYNDCIGHLKKRGVYKQCTLIRGDILKTVPKFFEDIEKLSIAMLLIDTDLYEPAKISTELFWPHICNGGVVYFHDYGDIKWQGIKKVVDKLVAEDDNLLFYRFDCHRLCSACVVKGISEESIIIMNKIKLLDKGGL